MPRIWTLCARSRSDIYLKRSLSIRGYVHGGSRRLTCSARNRAGTRHSHSSRKSSDGRNVELVGRGGSGTNGNTASPNCWRRGAEVRCGSTYDHSLWTARCIVRQDQIGVLCPCSGPALRSSGGRSRIKRNLYRASAAGRNSRAIVLGREVYSVACADTAYS